MTYGTYSVGTVTSTYSKKKKKKKKLHIKKYVGLMTGSILLPCCNISCLFKINLIIRFR